MEVCCATPYECQDPDWGMQTIASCLVLCKRLDTEIAEKTKHILSICKIIV